METNFETLANQAHDIEHLERSKAKALFKGAGNKQPKPAKENVKFEEPKKRQITDPVIEERGIKQAEFPSEPISSRDFEKQLKNKLINEAMDKICGDSPFLDVTSTPISQEPNPNPNYQTQIGGTDYYHKRKGGFEDFFFS